MKKIICLLLFMCLSISSVFALTQSGDNLVVPKIACGKTSGGAVTEMLVDDDGKLVISGSGGGGDSNWTAVGDTDSSLAGNADIEGDLSVGKSLTVSDTVYVGSVIGTGTGSTSLTGDLAVSTSIGINDATPDAYLDIVQSATLPYQDMVNIDTLTTNSVFLIDENGNVGIGTSTPTVSLDIDKSGADNTVYLQRPGSTINSFWKYTTTGTCSIGTDGPDDFTLYANGTGAILHLEGDGAGGNIGIGTIEPQSRFTIKQSANAATGGFLFEKSSSTTAAGLYLDPTTNIHMHIADVDKLKIYEDGDMEIFGDLSGSGDLTFEGTISGGLKDLSQSGSLTIDASQCYGSVIDIGGTSITGLPTVVEGMNLIFSVTTGTPSIDVQPGDKIWLDGTWLDDGDKIDASAAGDSVFLWEHEGDWKAISKGFTDGGV